MPYLNVLEVESALATAANGGTIAERITLPNPTWENRTSHALRIATGSGASRPAVFLLGGIHADEWGSSDTLVAFIEVLEHAYTERQGITLGARSFAAADIQRIVDSLDLIIFPEVNPDGRNWSMGQDPTWRKNRRPAPAGVESACAGVDLDRNYDVVWNYPKYFDPTAGLRNSMDACSDHYIGPAAFSEPETRNVKWIFDQYPNIRLFIDIHGFPARLQYGWAFAPDQSSNPSMNFLNPVHDGERGLPGRRAYREYVPREHTRGLVQLVNRTRAAMHAVNGTNYRAEHAFSMYAAAGTGADYASARHRIVPGANRIYSLTLGFGQQLHPPYAEMQHAMQDVAAGLLELCLVACEWHTFTAKRGLEVATVTSSRGSTSVGVGVSTGGQPVITRPPRRGGARSAHAGALPPTPPARKRPARDEEAAAGDALDCSVFGPNTATPGDNILIQVFAHLPKQDGRVMKRAREADPDAQRRGSRRLQVQVPLNSELWLTLALPGLVIDKPAQALTWRGPIECVQFGVLVPEEMQPRQVVGTVTAWLERVPIGEIRFQLKVIGHSAARERGQEIGQRAHTFQHAFLSYASADRSEVLKRAQALRLAGIDFFQDLLSLEPGQRWERELYRHIDEADVFILFWSSAASQSAWVLREVQYALSRKGPDESAPPAIYPLIIEGPPPVRPPEELKDLHFNDPLVYLLGN